MLTGWVTPKGPLGEQVDRDLQAGSLSLQQGSLEGVAGMRGGPSPWGRPEVDEGLWPPHSENPRLFSLLSLAVMVPSLCPHHVPSPEPSPHCTPWSQGLNHLLLDLMPC